MTNKRKIPVAYEEVTLTDEAAEILEKERLAAASRPCSTRLSPATSRGTTVKAPKCSDEHDHKIKVLEVDTIRVGPLVMTRTPDGGAGIWIGGQNGTPLVALFHIKGDRTVSAQTGAGVYASADEQACNACLTADHEGGGRLQLARGDEVEYLTIDDLKKIKALP